MRLIDADKLKPDEVYILPSGRKIPIAAYSQRQIDNAPTIEAEPIIRCKDCKYWSEPNMFDSYCRKTSVSDRIIYTQPDHYCCFAERKDDA